MESTSPPQKLRKDPCVTFIRTDGVLLEVRNRKVECCIWSLVATTSHILALKLTASWELLIRSLPLLFWVAAWLPLIVLAYHSLWTKCTPWFTSFIEPYHGDSATFYSFTLLVLVYRLFWVSTLHGIGPLSSRVVMISTVRSYTHPVLLSQRRSSLNAPMFDSAWKFLPDRGCRLNLEIWEGLFHFWASAWVVEPRRSNDEAQHKWSLGAHSDSTRGYVAHTRKEKLHGRPRSLLRSVVQYPRISTTNASFIVFLCPSFINLRMRFL
jgi:hypothetical protein